MPRDDRPKPIDMGEITASTMDRRKGERWYWRARTKVDRRIVWRGYVTVPELYRELGGLVSRGIPSAPAAQPEDARTVRDLFQHWQDFQSKREQAGQIGHFALKTYKQRAAYWNEAIGDVRLSALYPAKIEDVILDWGAAGVGARTIGGAVKALRAAVVWGREHQMVIPAKVESVKKPPEGDYIYCSATPTNEQLARLIAVLDRETTSGRLILLACWLGCRIGEVTSLRVGDFNREASELRLSGADSGRRRRGKTGVRMYPLEGETLAYIRDLAGLRDPGEYLVPRDGVNPEGASWHYLKACCERAGIPALSANSLRRHADEELVRNGGPSGLKAAAEVQGHSVETMLRIYHRPTADDRRALVKATGLGQVVAFPVRAQASGTDDEGGR